MALENPSVKASVYAALILADEGVEISADKITALVDAAGFEDYEPIYAKLIAKALAGRDASEFFFALGAAPAAAAAPVAAAAAPAGGDAPAAKEEKKGGDKKKKDEPEEEEDADMGFGLFD